MSERPGRVALWWSGLSGGLFGGSTVGVVEAIYLLSTTTPAEYQALPYAAALYGLLGAGVGAAVGVGLALGGPWMRWSRGFGWAAGFVVVTAAFGYVILAFLLNKAVFSEQGLPTSATVTLGLGWVGFALFGLWIGSVVLNKTPLRALATPKGTAVGWALVAGLSFLFSLAPAPGGSWRMVPHRPQAEDAATKPDILLVHIDALRADAVGTYGGPAGATPNLDTFAADAVVFEQAITQASWTRASTASLFTSLLPSSHNCATKDAALSPAVDTLAEVLQRGGYATGGLPNNANITGALGFGQGFDYYPYTPEYPLGADESTFGLSLYSVARRAYARVMPRRRVEDDYTPAEVQLDHALAYAVAQGTDRWFLYVHLMEPHDPYFRHPYDGYAIGRAELPAPEASRSDELRALYAGEVNHADAALGAFFAGLKASGTYDEALIIVTSDHGEEFQDHGGWWHGTTLYDEQVHVPLIVKLPGNTRAGTRVPWQVREIDIAPTIVDIARVAASSQWRGVPLVGDDFDAMLALSLPPELPVEDDIDGGQAAPAEAPVPWVPPGWANHPASLAALSEEDFEGYHLQSLRVNGKKLIDVTRTPLDAEREPGGCFDLLADPGEHANLAGTGCEGALKAWLAREVEQARSEAVVGQDAERNDAHAERLRALGYPPAAGEVPP